MSDTPRCPRCQAPSFLAGINTRIFECESDGKTPSTACKYASQLQERIKRLEDIIDRAANRFFADGPDGQTAAEMLKILSEKLRRIEKLDKGAKP